MKSERFYTENTMVEDAERLRHVVSDENTGKDFKRGSRNRFGVWGVALM